MNKEKIENLPKDKEKSDSQKDIGKKVSLLINKILSEPNENFGDRINYVINKVLDSIPQDISEHIEKQKEIFDQIFDFLNKIFKDIHVKKFYNNIPNIDIVQYANKDLGNQFVNNVYGKERKIFYRDEIQGGSCHHRTIFFKKLFEKLEEKGFDIKSRIILYTLPGGHSEIILNFLGEKYFADLYGTEELYLAKKLDKMVINTFKGLNKVAGIDICSKFSFNKEKDKGMIYYKNIDDFANFIKIKKNNTATIEFKPRLENSQEKDIRIEIAKDYINLIIDGNTENIKRYRLNNLEIPKYLKNSPEILDFIIKSISCQKENKCEIAKYFKMIRDKINPEKIYEIFNNQEIE